MRIGGFQKQADRRKQPRRRAGMACFAINETPFIGS
jgi:hypothetical protein